MAIHGPKRSYKVTATGLVHTGKIFVHGISLVPGSTAASVTLNDSTDGSGTDKAGIKTDSTWSENILIDNLVFDDGVYVTLSGTGAVAYIYFD